MSPLTPEQRAAKTREKDPDATLDFLWDWGDEYLEGGDTIASFEFLVPEGIEKTAESHTDTTVTGWFSGGTAGENYLIVCRIFTAAGRCDDWTMTLKVRQH